MRQYSRPKIGLDLDVIFRFVFQSLLAALDKVFGAALHPRMVECGVIGHKVEHQFDAAPRQPFAEMRQPGLAAKCVTDPIGSDRKTRTADVVLGQIGQSRVELGSPFWVAARHRAPGSADLPHAQQPNPIETLRGKAIDRRVVDIGERDPFTSLA